MALPDSGFASRPPPNEQLSEIWLMVGSPVLNGCEPGIKSSTNVANQLASASRTGLSFI
jgi:hypothetical protein